MRKNKSLILKSILVALIIGISSFAICSINLNLHNNPCNDTKDPVSTNSTYTEKHELLDKGMEYDKDPGTFTNPLNGYDKFTADFFNYGDPLGEFTVQLADYREGDDAWKIVKKNRKNKQPRNGQQYIYLKFIISNVNGKTTDGADIVNFFTHLYLNDGDQIEALGWGSGYENIPCISGTQIARGESRVCSVAILFDQETKGILYKLETGQDDSGNSVYTWFTAKEKEV